MVIANPLDALKTREESERQARLEALLRKRDAIIDAGMETWDYDRINADVQERRGTDRSS